MVPDSPRSGHDAKSCQGPKLGGGLPAGSQPSTATADGSRRDREVRLIIDKYLGPSEAGTAVPISQSLGANDEDAMSITSIDRLGKRTREVESHSDSDVNDQPVKSRRILRSRVIGSDSENEGPVVVSDSPEGVKTNV